MGLKIKKRKEEIDKEKEGTRVFHVRITIHDSKMKIVQ